jgi:hypothetical protein
VIMADTRGELPQTYAYAYAVASLLAEVDVPFNLVSAGDLRRAIMNLEQYPNANPSPPVYLLDPQGKRSKLNAYRCSYDFKRRPVARKVKELCGPRGAWKRANVEQWIGFTTDEDHRCKADNECRCGDALASHCDDDGRPLPGGCARCRCSQFERWRTNRWPLIEMGMTRADCVAWLTDHGYPVPPRSACTYCPNSSDERWATLKADHPDEWEAACEMDEVVRTATNFGGRRADTPLKGVPYLHRSMTPLRSADLRTRTAKLADSGVRGMFDLDACTAEMCGSDL